MSDYVSDNYVLMVMLIGMFILTMFDVYLDRDMLFMLRCAVVAIFALSIFSYVEEYYGNLPESTIWRAFYSAVCYSLRPYIIMLIIFIVYRKTSRWIAVPAIINMILVFGSIFTGVVFYFTSDNSFQRGPLGYLPYVVSGFYLIGLLVISIKTATNHYKDETMVIFYITLATMGSTIFDLMGFRSSTIVDHTAGAMILLYYLYIYAQYTKRDELTGLYNRHSYYSDIEKYREDVTGVISIDMNELKWLNDTMGHEAGDKGIVKVSECFRDAANSTDSIYRIGGDEFIILCFKKNKTEIKSMIEKMRNNIDEAGYSCAFGYSTGKVVEDMIREADSFMYEDKAKIKAEMKAKGITLHPRD